MSLFSKFVLFVAVFTVSAKSSTPKSSLEQFLEDENILVLNVKSMDSGYTLVEYTEDLQDLDHLKISTALMGPKGNPVFFVEPSNSGLALIVALQESLATFKSDGNFQLTHLDCNTTGDTTCCTGFGMTTYPDGSYCESKATVCMKNGVKTKCITAANCFDAQGNHTGGQSYNCMGPQLVPTNAPPITDPGTPFGF